MSRAAYMREYRATPSGRAQVDAQKKRAKARTEAIKRLIASHETEFERLFSEELRKAIG